MKKIGQTFIAWLLVAFLTVTAVPLAIAQKTPSPQPTAPISQPEEAIVVLDGESLFTIKQPLGNITPLGRAKAISARLLQLAEDNSLSLEDIQVYVGDKEGVPLTQVSAGNIAIMTVTEVDARVNGKSREELTQIYLQKIKEVVSRYRQERSLQNIVRGVGFILLATIVLLVALSITNNIFARIYQQLKIWGNTYIRGVRIGNLELIRPNQLDNITDFIARIVQTGIILGLFVFYIPFVLRQFPWTSGLASTLDDYFSGTLQTAWKAFVDYLPNLFTVVLTIAIAYFLLRASKPFFRELSEGTISLPGFYVDWAWPTYRIVTFLIVALSAVIVFPLLPGFNSPAFGGISVFLGLLLSLGSTSAIANLVAGTILIYTRAFQVGDLIKIRETSGRVIETTLLVTRLITGTNVVISIPNSEIITSSVENLSFASKELDQPLIMRTSVHLGYEVPWRQAYDALMQAALRTEGVAKSPLPFVLQDSLNEVFVTYQLSGYIDWEFFQEKTVKEFEQARSQLHENIRDCCAELGIKIFAPSYEADPTNYGPVADLSEQN
jgi:small-conductance mechanosensitive channel